MVAASSGTPSKRALVDAIWDTYVSLRMLDVGAMKLPEKHKYVEQLDAVLHAHLALENANFAKVLGRARAEVTTLHEKTLAVQTSLQGFKTTAEVLNIVGSALGIFTSLVTLFA